MLPTASLAEHQPIGKREALAKLPPDFQAAHKAKMLHNYHATVAEMPFDRVAALKAIALDHEVGAELPPDRMAALKAMGLYEFREAVAGLCPERLAALKATLLDKYREAEANFPADRLAAFKAIWMDENNDALAELPFDRLAVYTAIELDQYRETGAELPPDCIVAHTALELGQYPEAWAKLSSDQLVVHTAAAGLDQYREAGAELPPDRLATLKAIGLDQYREAGAESGPDCLEAQTAIVSAQGAGGQSRGRSNVARPEYCSMAVNTSFSASWKLKRDLQRLPSPNGMGSGQTVETRQTDLTDGSVRGPTSNGTACVSRAVIEQRVFKVCLLLYREVSRLTDLFCIRCTTYEFVNTGPMSSKNSFRAQWQPCAI